MPKFSFTVEITAETKKEAAEIYSALLAAAVDVGNSVPTGSVAVWDCPELNFPD